MVIVHQTAEMEHIRVIALAVQTVQHRNKPASQAGKYNVCVPAYLHEVPSQAGQVLDENDIDASGLCVSNQALEDCSRVAVIHIGVHFIPAPLPHIPLKQQLLIFNADGFPVSFVIVA